MSVVKLKYNRREVMSVEWIFSGTKRQQRAANGMSCGMVWHTFDPGGVEPFGGATTVCLHPHIKALRALEEGLCQDATLTSRS